MNLLIVGGTGFLGYHAAKECVRRGHAVSILAKDLLPSGALLPSGVELHLSALERLSDGELRRLLDGKNGVVVAAGADDRIVPSAPAYPYFHRANVEACVRLFTVARAAGVRRGVLLGSYLAYFDRIWPELKLAENHPYIRSRKEQEEQVLRAAVPDLHLVILELPLVFGAMAGRTPLWSPLVDYVRAWPVLFAPTGGTNALAVAHVAEAVAGALERGESGERYLVGDENITWRDLLGRLAVLVTGRKKPVITIPAFALRLKMRSVAKRQKSEGKESGLDPVEFVALMTVDTCFDPVTSRDVLGYGRGGLNEALRDTVAACIRDTN